MHKNFQNPLYPQFFVLRRHSDFISNFDLQYVNISPITTTLKRVSLEIAVNFNIDIKEKKVKKTTKTRKNVSNRALV